MSDTNLDATLGEANTSDNALTNAPPPRSHGAQVDQTAEIDQAPVAALADEAGRERRVRSAVETVRPGQSARQHRGRIRKVSLRSPLRTAFTKLMAI